MKTSKSVVNLIFKNDLIREYAPNEWAFIESAKIIRIHPKLHIAEKLMEEGELESSEEKFREIIKSAPDCIEAYNDLYHCLCYQGKFERAFQDLENIVQLLIKALPEKLFTKGQTLSWGFLENRSFMRLYENLGFAYLEEGMLLKAKTIFESLLGWNRNDNQGIREYAITAYFELKDPASIIKLCSHYPEDALAGVLYGWPLALCMQGKMDKARKVLKRAIEYLPKVAKELLKEKHRRPKSSHPGFITLGGEDQAYAYWDTYGKYWHANEEAMLLLKNVVQAPNSSGF